MPRIDIEAVLKSKAPRAARWVPRPLIDYLRRIVHEREINEVLERAWELPPQAFIHEVFDCLEIDYTIEGLERLDPKGRYLFASNHPFGGMDGLMLADKLIDRFGDVRVVVNDLLMHIEPLRPLWVPVNKHGAQNAAYARRFDEAMYGELPVLTFPAGLCSRRRKGEVSDLEWKTSFVKRAYASQREIVPVFVEGRLSDFFYRLSNLRQALGIRFNVEMLYLADEMFRQRGRTFRIRVGEPIPMGELQAFDGLREQTDYIRKKAYFLAKTAENEPVCR